MLFVSLWPIEGLEGRDCHIYSAFTSFLKFRVGCFQLLLVIIFFNWIEHKAMQLFNWANIPPFVGRSWLLQHVTTREVTSHHVVCALCTVQAPATCWSSDLWDYRARSITLETGAAPGPKDHNLFGGSVARLEGAARRASLARAPPLPVLTKQDPHHFLWPQD